MLTMKTSYISHVLLLELKFVSRDTSMQGNLLNEMILPFNFSSTMFVHKSFKVSVTAISLSYDICSVFQN